MSVEPSVNRRLFGNVGLNLGAQLIIIAINFATIPFIVGHLGAELFGIVALVQTIAGFAGILNVGIGRALVKYVSELYWRGETDKINELFQTAWAICLIAGSLACLIVVWPSHWISNTLFRGTETADADLITFAIYISAGALFSTIVLDAVSAIPLAAQRFWIRNTIQIGVTASWCLGSVALLNADYSIRSVLITYFLSNIAGAGGYIFFCMKLIPGLSLWPRVHWTALVKLANFSLPITISAISAILVTRLDRFILAYYLPIAAVAYYTLPYSMAEKMSTAVANVTSVVFPFASELHSMNAKGKLHELYLRATKMLTVMILPMTVILVAIPWEILRFWLGEEYANQGATSMSLIGLSGYLNALTAVPSMICLAIGRVWLCAIFAFLTAAFNLVANFVLIPHFGISGAAAGLLFSQVTIFPFVYLVNRILQISPWEFFSQTLLRPLVCGIAQFGFLYGVQSYINGIVSLLIACISSVSVFGILALYGVATAAERKHIWNWRANLKS